MGTEVVANEETSIAQPEPARQPRSAFEGKAAQEIIRDQHFDRRLAFGQAFFVVPEQVMGSYPTVSVPVPMNVDKDGRTAQIAASITGQQFAIESLPKDLPSVHGLQYRPGTQSVEMRLMPSRTGNIHETLTLRVSWPDGHDELQQIAIFGKVRFIDEAPSPVLKPATHEAGEPRSPETTLVPDPADDINFNSRMADLHIEIDNLVDAQKQGVTDVNAEALKFVPPEPPESLWAVLVQMAIIMGTAGTAAMLGKFVAGQVERGVKSLLSSGKTAGTALKYLEEGVSAATEDGLKDAAQKALAHRHEGATPSKPAGESEKDEDSGASKDSTIAFFSQQFAILRNLKTQQAHNLVKATEHLRNLLAINPQAALAGVKAMTLATVATQQSALKFQARATTSAWLSYVAQEENGAVKSKNEDGETQVTKMNGLIGKRGYLSSTVTDGVLELDVGGSDRPGIGAARIFGIGHAMAERLLTMSLTAPGIPIRFRVGAVTVTRDESGRVRVNRPGDSDPTHEPQWIAPYENLVNLYLSRPLRSWGITHIETNDQGKEK